MGDALVVAVPVGVESRDPQHRVVGITATVGGVGSGGVGDPKQELVDLLGHLARFVGQGLFAVAELTTGGLSRLGLGGTALLAELAHLLGPCLDLVPEVVSVCRQLTMLGIELDHDVYLGGVDPSTGQGGLHLVGFGAESADVQHETRR
jgi:hypothetical protein